MSDSVVRQLVVPPSVMACRAHCSTWPVALAVRAGSPDRVRVAAAADTQ